MKLSDIKSAIEPLNSIQFILPNGTFVPLHFHVTEIGLISKEFIDCGGTMRHEKVINFQLWEANDFDHRLAPKRLSEIIKLSEEKLGLPNIEVEVEYQSDTIGKYDLEFDGANFVLVSKQTNCLALDQCGIPAIDVKVNANSQGESCAPGSGCC